TFWLAFLDQSGARMNLWKYDGVQWAAFPVTFAAGPYTDVSLELYNTNPQLAYTVPGTASGSQKLIFHPWAQGGGGFSSPVTIDASLGTISSVSLAYGASFPRIGYVGNGVAKVARGSYSATQWPCAWAREAADATGNMDSQVSLVVNPGNDETWLLYRDLGAQGMRSARWLDTAPPAAATFLAVSGGCDSLYVSWNATGDDGNVGNATSYDLRWSGSPITTDAAFNGSVGVPAPVPIPGPPGT